MSTPLRYALRAAVVAALATGCETAPPGAGITNGVDPATISNPETSAARSDMPVPPPAADPDKPLEEAAATGPASPETNRSAGNPGAGAVRNPPKARAGDQRPAAPQ
jgi:hypothetical protein